MLPRALFIPVFVAHQLNTPGIRHLRASTGGENSSSQAHTNLRYTTLAGSLRRCVVIYFYFMSHPLTAVQKTVLSLCDRICREEYPVGSLLPNVKELAAASGVSVPTLGKATRFLAGREILDGAAGKRFGVREGSHSQCREIINELHSDFADQNIAGYWELVKNRIKQDILQGKYKAGRPMPSLKELTAAYETSFRTLKKALSHLQGEGLIAPHKKSFCVKRIVADPRANKVVFIMLADKYGRFQLGSLNQDYLRNLELECSNARLTAEIIGHSSNTEDLFFLGANGKKCVLPESEFILGYIFLVVAYTRAVDTVLAELAQLRKPIAVLDITGGWRVPPYACNRHFGYFSAAVSPRSARNVARYLLACGHRRCAYISAFHQALWSQNRLSGLREIYASAGIEGGIKAYTLDHPPRYYRFYFEEKHSLWKYDQLKQAYEQWKRSIPGFLQQQLDPHFSFTLPERIIPEAVMRGKIEPLFEAAVQDKNVTAWIVCNDDIAAWALDYLQMRDLEVPRRISVIAFDDTLQAQRIGLTSYNFNMAAMTHLMLNFVLNRRMDNRALASGPTEIEGTIIERTTVANKAV
ncbi:MAG: GntR family transcriptional regulator [Chitinivibrionales bacterium]|nr:GntR family transcriptional regulator [Chitinivibrionales bacterium]